MGNLDSLYCFNPPKGIDFISTEKPRQGDAEN
jgi:hypothetical protein